MANEEYKSDLTDVAVVIIRRNDRSVICRRLTLKTPSACFPLSLVEVSDNGDGQSHTLTCPDWKLKQVGWL